MKKGKFVRSNHLHYISNAVYSQHQPAATSSAFICNELPVRYTHILRLLSTLSPDSLQSPIIRNVAHSYLRDICTLLHPSLKGTSPKAIAKVFSNLRQSQATNLIRLKYALLSNPTAASATLMENINTIGFGIHLLLGKWHLLRIFVLAKKGEFKITLDFYYRSTSLMGRSIK